MQTIKIIVAGAYGAGKSTFIQSVCCPERAPSARHRPGGASALDLGRFLLDEDHVVNLYAAPVQQRFAYLCEILIKDAQGLIMLVDGSRPETFCEAREALDRLRGLADVPVVTGVTRRDAPSACRLEAVREELNLREGDLLVECDPRRAESASGLTRKLLTRVPLLRQNAA